MAQQGENFASSTGQVMTGGDWLDVHFEAAKPEYEAQLRSVGIQPGWKVLDAACGSGAFLPWIAELVGPGGHVFALDLAPDNVALVEHRILSWDLPCPVEVRVGNVLELPYADDTFDAVWFANTSQYLSAQELGTALGEFRRVVRPGGLIALKESDVSIYRCESGPSGLMLRWFEASARNGNAHATNGLRAPRLPSCLRRAGLANVWQRSTLIERPAPLAPAVRTNWGSLLDYLSKNACELELPTADQDFWSRLRRPGAIEQFLDDPDCWLVEGNVLTVGTEPASGRTGG